MGVFREKTKCWACIHRGMRPQILLPSPELSPSPESSPSPQILLPSPELSPSPESPSREIRLEKDDDDEHSNIRRV